MREVANGQTESPIFRYRILPENSFMKTQQYEWNWGEEEWWEYWQVPKRFLIKDCTTPMSLFYKIVEKKKNLKILTRRQPRAGNKESIICWKVLKLSVELGEYFIGFFRKCSRNEKLWMTRNTMHQALKRYPMWKCRWMLVYFERFSETSKDLHSLQRSEQFLMTGGWIWKCYCAESIDSIPTAK